ncbi:hypothetical protein GPX89_22220 [Nocardia sp. ET3-3]|uniref:Succinate dehydrogenase n=1 Tax=Nocardia terrae TaxID=2675851 RepID=A0A7K1V1B6_9NOCA|nr:hypothetical protein [Nocardia terrae]
MSAAPVKAPESGTTGVFSRGRAAIAARTLRTDQWWLPPLVTVLGFATFIIYATVRSFQHNYYWVAKYEYLTPFYSPCLSKGCVEGSTHFGTPIPDLPHWIPLGFLVLPFLLLFRLTCYYYRKAYYRSVWMSPPACAVAEPHAKYSGETRLPLIIQNAHRYFFYIAVIISLINTYDAVISFHSSGGFGIGLGTVIITANALLLWAYTLSCHSCRHIAGGRLKHFSQHPVRYRFWTVVSKLNTRHMQLAWTTLGTLMLTDLYVALVAAGKVTDLRFIG